MKIAFHVYNFTFRGSEVALFDYALYNRSILGNLSIIVCPLEQKTVDIQVLEKFRREFNIIYYRDLDHLDSICREEKVDALYTIKYGKDDGLVLKNTPIWVHCVFTTDEPHGSVYAAVSDSVAIKNKNNVKYPIVNHVVYLPPILTDYRKELSIKDTDLVVGRHGGSDTFDISYTKDAILDVLSKREDIWFIFCVKPIVLDKVYHPRIVYLDSFVDNRIKRKFINTCDVMLHASTLGESFGLSVLEFSFCGKPVITWNGGLWHRQHLDNLGDKAILYSSRDELVDILLNIKKEKNDYSSIVDRFVPSKIMEQFNNVFIKSLNR